MMKGSLGVTCLLWILVGTALALKPLTFEPSKVYEYEAESTLLAGIPDQEDQYSGLSLAYKVRISSQGDKAVIQLDDVRSGRLNDETPVSYHEDIEFQRSPSPEFQAELSKPFVVFYKAGVIDKLQFEEDDEAWSVNMKKGIVSNFQLDLTKTGDHLEISGNKQEINPEALSYELFEDGIRGECETRYQIMSIQSLDHPDQSTDVFNVTKVKNFRNCRGKIYEAHNFESQGCPDTCRLSEPMTYKSNYPVYDEEYSSACETGCRYGFQPDFHPVKSYSLRKYNVSGVSHQPLIEGIYNEGKSVYTVNGDEIIVVVQQNFTLLSVRTPKVAVPQLKSPEIHESLEYKMPVDESHKHLEFSGLSIFGPIENEDLVSKILKKLEDAAEDIIPDDPKTSQWLGTKIIELQLAVSALSHEDLDDILSQLERASDQRRTASKPNIMRSIYLDVLAIAATNIAANFSLELIRTERVSVSESVELLSGFAKNMQQPHRQIILGHLSLLNDSRVEEEPMLFSAVGVALGKLVEQSCVKPTLIPSEDIFAQSSVKKADEQDEDEEDEDLDQYYQYSQNFIQTSKKCRYQHLQEYVEEVAELLKSEEDLHKKIIYIETLGHMSTPLALEHLEPYITGEAPELQAFEDEEVEYLKTVAIYSLHNINDYYNEEVMPFVSSVYFDDNESYEVRIAAFSVIMESNPGLVILERIASELWDENSNQVASFVTSYLQDVANSTEPCQRKLAQQVQLILAHAPEVELGIQYSNTYSYDFYDDERDYGVSADLQYVASNVSNIPRAAYLSLSHINGPFGDDLLEVGYTAKGLDELLDKISRPGGILSQIISQMGGSVQPENLDKVLQIVRSKIGSSEYSHETTRASIYYKLFGRTTYLTVDEKHIYSIIVDIVHWFIELDPSSSTSHQYVKVWMPSSFFKILPSSLGLPVVFNSRNPIIFSIVVENVELVSDGNKEVPLDAKMNLSLTIRPSVHISSVVLVYAVSAPEDILYGVGVERVYEVSTPLTVSLEIDLKNSEYSFAINPRLPHQVLSHFTRPTTFQAKAVLIDVSLGDWLSYVNKIENIPEPIQYDRRMESDYLGLSLRVEASTERAWADIPVWLSGTAYEDGVFPAIVELLKNPGIVPRDVHVYLDPSSEHPSASFVMQLNYDRDIYPRSQDSEAQSVEKVDETYHDALRKIYGKRYEFTPAKRIIDDLVQKTQMNWAPVLGYSKPTPALIAHTFTLFAILSGPQTKLVVSKLIYAHSLDHRVIWSQLTGHKSSVDRNQQALQFCGHSVVVFPQEPNPFYLEMNPLHAEKATLNAYMGWGVNCERENRVTIRGSIQKSEEQMSSSSNVFVESTRGQLALPWYFHECQVQRSEGETQSYACQLAISEAAQLNKIDLIIEYPDLSPMAQNWTSKLDLALKSYFYPNMEVNPLADNPERSLHLVIESIDAIPDVDLTNVYIYKPTENVFFEKLYTPYYSPLSSLDSLEEIYGDMAMEGEYSPSCNLMEDFVSTIDNVTYELPDNKCQYILAKDCSSDSSFTILMSQVNIKQKTKALSVLIAGHTIKLLPPTGKGIPVVINKESLTVSSGKPVVKFFNMRNEIYMYVKNTVGTTDSPVLVLEISGYGITIEYDGKNAELSLPREYKGDVCGLCGDFNDEDFWEFTGPKGCTYVNATDFANSYLVPGQHCADAPKVRGPAFCPDPELQKKLNDEDSSEDSEESQGPARPHKEAKKDQSDSKVKPTDSQPSRSGVRTTAKPNSLAHRSKPQQVSDEEDDEPSPRKVKPTLRSRTTSEPRRKPASAHQERSEEDEDDDVSKRRQPARSQSRSRTTAQPRKATSSSEEGSSEERVVAKPSRVHPRSRF